MSCVNAQLVGQVACGEPIDAIENIKGDFVLLAELYAGNYNRRMMGVEMDKNYF